MENVISKNSLVMSAHSIKFVYNTLILFIFCTIESRSIYRPSQTLPQITVSWQDTPQQLFSLTDSHFEEYPLFKISTDYLQEYVLAKHTVSYQYLGKNKSIPGAYLSQLIEELLEELHQRKKKFKHFIVLKNKNFNHKKNCGLLVLQFKEYPFVIKLFMERPETFIDYHCKGPEPIFFFYMAGGANRHISGLTRIKNLTIIQEQIKRHSYWVNHIELPRKWFWTPSTNRLITVQGMNIGNKLSLYNTFPATYAIIADAIDTKEKNSFPTKKKNKIIMQLCNDLNLFIDPHQKNFIFKQHPITKEPIITIIDTEHFPSMLGIKQKKKFCSHESWLLYLITKCFKDIFLRTKATRHAAQSTPHELCLSFTSP